MGGTPAVPKKPKRPGSMVMDFGDGSGRQSRKSISNVVSEEKTKESSFGNRVGSIDLGNGAGIQTISSSASSSKAEEAAKQVSVDIHLSLEDVIKMVQSLSERIVELESEAEVDGASSPQSFRVMSPNISRDGNGRIQFREITLSQDKKGFIRVAGESDGRSI